MKSFLISIFFVVLATTSVIAQNVDFDVSPSLCIDERVSLTNLSVSQTDYLWDFCNTDLAGSGEAFLTTQLTTGNFLAAVQVQYDSGNWFGFASSTLDDKLFRLRFGDSLSNTPMIDDLGNLSGTLNGLKDLELLKEGGVWYGLIINSDGQSITRLTFENGLGGNISGENLGNFGVLNRPIGLDLSVDGTDVIASVVDLNGNNVRMINFGNSITNSAGSATISTFGSSAILNRPTSVSIVEIEGNWFGILTSRNNDKVFKLEFGNSLSLSPTITEIATLDEPEGSEIIIEGQNTYVMLVARGTSPGLYRIPMADGFIANPIESLGNYGVISDSRNVIFAREAPDWHLFAADAPSEEIYRISFFDDCELNADTDFEPVISYGAQGMRSISLTGVDAFGIREEVVKDVVIDSDMAPPISFQTVNRCISVSNTFIPSTPGLVSYDWDFDDDGVVDISDGTGTSQVFSYPTPGTYTARLDVNDGICHNFTELQITIYPDPPIPTFNVVSSECTNTSILFTNTTDESQHVGALLYKWDFDNDGIIDSTDPNPTFTYTTPGVKTVLLIDSIPGCSNVSSAVNITINDGPISNFTATDFSICEGDFVTFTDTSTPPGGSAIDSWSWDFDNGQSSTSQNPGPVLYTTAGSYFVSLTTSDDSPNNCTNEVVQEVAVSPVPNVDFDFDVPCTSPNGIQFTDLSSVTGADIVSRRWFIDNLEVSTQQNPLLTFSSTGVVNVRLETTSSNGCENSYNEDIAILDSPIPTFSSSIECQGSASFFEDQTFSPSNPIVSWLWNVAGETYTTSSISHVFEGSGNFEVTLEVTAQNFCSATVTESIEVQQLPNPNFTIEGECSNQTLELVDTSTTFEDQVVSREWFLDGVSVGNGTPNFLGPLPNGAYEVSLQLTTEAGCTTSVDQAILINDSPQASFSATRSFGIPGDQIVFTDNSSGASSTQWLLNNVPLSSNMIEQSITFDSAGSQEVSLVVNNDLGCSDTLTNNVLIASPEVDLSIGQFDLIENGGVGTIFLEVENNSNLPIEVTNVLIELENQFSVSEQILTPLGIGESQLTNLDVGIPLNGTELTYLCVTLQSEYVGHPDTNPLDNERCVTVEPTFVIEPLFPNPVISQTRIKLISTGERDVVIDILDSAGKLRLTYSERAFDGLNNYFLDLSTMGSGIFFVRISAGDITQTMRVVKL